MSVVLFATDPHSAQLFPLSPVYIWLQALFGQFDDNDLLRVYQLWIKIHVMNQNCISSS